MPSLQINTSWKRHAQRSTSRKRGLNDRGVKCQIKCHHPWERLEARIMKEKKPSEGIYKINTYTYRDIIYFIAHGYDLYDFKLYDYNFYILPYIFVVSHTHSYN